MEWQRSVSMKISRTEYFLTLPIYSSSEWPPLDVCRGFQYIHKLRWKAKLISSEDVDTNNCRLKGHTENLMSVHGVPLSVQ